MKREGFLSISLLRYPYGHTLSIRVTRFWSERDGDLRVFVCESGRDRVRKRRETEREREIVCVRVRVRV